MKYDLDHIDLKYILINCFLFKADKAILDISYSLDEKKITVQVVALDGFILSKRMINNLKENLVSLEVIIKELYLTKEQFNESKGEWQPKHYKWLDHLLFSKAEVL
jgi:hypothetical protein